MYQYEAIQKKESGRKLNRTGIPDAMKAKAEEKSGFSFDDVKVHYHSEKPAQFEALAYTRGSDVYIGPGQERYLGHELGHVAQQMEGRVNASTHLGGLPVNDDRGLEREADDFL